MKPGQSVSCKTGHRLLAFGLGVVLLLATAFAPGSAFAKARTVRVGVYQNKPKIFMDKNGHASGFFIQLLEKIAAQEDWTLVYVPCEWAACLQDLSSGQIDLMPDMAYSEQRAAIYDFHKIPVVESWSSVYASPKASIDKLADLDGKRIAVLNGSIQQTVFQELMNGFGYQVTLILTDSYDQAFALAQNNLADAAISNQFFGDYFYQKYGLEKTTIAFNPVDLYYATAKGKNGDLLAAIDNYLGKWIPDQRSPYYTTLGNWTPQEPYRLPGYAFGIIGGIIVLLLAAAGMILLLRHQVRIRTQTLQKANEELEESEERYQTLARISPVGIFRTDPQGATTYVNPTWSAISGLAVEKALGDGWLAAVHPDDRERLSQGWQENAHQHIESYSDYRFLRPDGTIAWVMGQAVPEINTEGQVIGYVGTITDITERKLAEQEIQKLNAELELRVAERTAQLQSANKELEAFSYSVSHDLRAPLRAISGFASIIARRHRESLNEEGRHYFDNIVQASERMGHLIDDLLTYGRLGRSGVKHEAVPLDALIDEINRNMQGHLTEIHGSLSIAKELPVVSGDPTLLSQIFTNLLENAFKYHKPDVPPQVSLTWTAEGQNVVVKVTDNGIGIPPEYHQKIFNVFQRLHSEEEYPGTGIGLATVKKAVELLGGSVWVESKEGEGSTFSVRLPKE